MSLGRRLTDRCLPAACLLAGLLVSAEGQHLEDDVELVVLLTLVECGACIGTRAHREARASRKHWRVPVQALMCKHSCASTHVQVLLCRHSRSNTLSTPVQHSFVSTPVRMPAMPLSRQHAPVWQQFGATHTLLCASTACCQHYTGNSTTVLEGFSG